MNNPTLSHKIRITALPTTNPLKTSKAESERPFRRRAGRARVRTGCITCKIRHVKCDEAKPHCMNCISGKWKCDGYSQPIQGPKKAARSIENGPTDISLYNPAFDVSQDSTERRSFHYFRSRVSYVTGFFDCDFWDRLVLQAYHAEPTVKYALLALSATYEAHELQGQNTKKATLDLSAPCSVFALQQYTKAVRILSCSLSTNKPSSQVTLICCLLFVLLELLRNDSITGLKHLKSGLQILRDIQQLESAVDKSLLSIFVRLQTQATIHGCPTSDFNSSISNKYSGMINPIPASFSNISQARTSLDIELNALFLCIRHEKEIQSSPLPSLDTPITIPPLEFNATPLSITAPESVCASSLVNLWAWHSALQNSPAILPHLTDPASKSARSIRMLQIYYEIAIVILETLFSDSELIYDQYTTNFERILELAETILGCDSTPPNLSVPASPKIINPATTLNAPAQPSARHDLMSTLACFDMQLIPPLFYVAIKCRILPLRSRAISLLKLTPEREGIWHRDTILRLAELKISVEEGGRSTRTSQNFGAEEAGNTHSQQHRIMDQHGSYDEWAPLPEQARICKERILDEKIEDGAAVGDGRARVQFHREVGGVDLFEEEVEIQGLLALMGDFL